MDIRKTISNLRRRLAISLKRWKSEDKAGLYITVIFHLTVIIVLLAYGIDSTIKREESFVLDFSKQEEIERVMKEKVFKEDISRKLRAYAAAIEAADDRIADQMRQWR